MAFRALLLNKSEAGAVSAAIETLDEARLPPGDVLVNVEYSTLNYKDGLVLGGLGGLVRQYPHIGGVDFSGVVAESNDPRFTAGDRVILTGWRVGEVWWGGYAEKARVKADWLVKAPAGLSTRDAMAIGTAGLTSMFAVMALEAHGLTPAKGEVLVTGAAGGVGSTAVAILAKLGYSVAAMTGRPETEGYLRGLGAASIVPRAEFTEVTKKPLESERWAACVDAVGGAVLGRVLKQLKYGGSAAAVGLTAGAAIDGALVTPFLLRGVNLLGIDSVMRPLADREAAWARLVTDLPMERLAGMIHPARLSDLPELGARILKGDVRGRVVVDVRA